MSVARGAAHFDSAAAWRSSPAAREALAADLRGVRKQRRDGTDNESTASDQRVDYRVDVSESRTIAHATCATFERFGASICWLTTRASLVPPNRRNATILTCGLA